jgi:hypothetical protein
MGYGNIAAKYCQVGFLPAIFAGELSVRRLLSGNAFIE